MLIRVRELELRKLEFGPDFRQSAPLKTEGRAELVVEHRGHRQDVEDIRMVGKLVTELQFSCARCLEPVDLPVNRVFDLIYRPQGVDRRAAEVAISEAETEIGYYQGEGLMLEDVLREQILLATPVRALCREDCKGLCPKCGLNLNSDSCQCAKDETDPRWQALGELKRKLQS
jgi:uncharacterized protein